MSTPAAAVRLGSRATATATANAVNAAAAAAVKPVSSSSSSSYSTSAGEEPAFDTLLIANRGEIACRVIKTCKKLGIKTVAIHSDADEKSLHVREADMAFNVGPAPSAESYLNMDKIMEAIQHTGAKAVHPGYGFLSENSKFCELLESKGVVFVGPKTRAIEAMGDKIESKLIAKEAGVNVIPGFDGEIDTLDQALVEAENIGYPVMLKASAGGGGKGMRVAWNPDEAREAWDLSKAEALASFGDDRMLIEKFIDEPRHIEIQVLADAHGNAIYLNERECSIQRRNQKVIEEAPSTFIDPETRKAMGEQAIMLAKAVDYQSAGTVEFLVDSQKNFYFLEMNTRLQVEHPITEQITKVDLVEQMINVAAGRPLPLQQSDIGIHGWAIESRVYAEDPENFLPSIGRLSTYIEPSLEENTEDSGVRCDSGIVEGSEISIYYDPMICKLVTYGKDREEATNLMSKALNSYVIKGVTHNIPLLHDIIEKDAFLTGKTTTKFMEEIYPDGFKGRSLSAPEKQQLLAGACYMHLSRMTAAKEFLNQRVIDREVDYPEFTLFLDGAEHHVKVGEFFGQYFIAQIDGEEVTMECSWDNGDPIMQANIDDSEVIMQYMMRNGNTYKIRFAGTPYEVKCLTTKEAELFDLMPEKPVVDTSNLIMTPMPGTLVSVAVQKGDTVSAGQEVAVVEAMKMQNSLRAARSGVIKDVYFEAGQTLADEDVIIEFEVEEVEA